MNGTFGDIKIRLRDGQITNGTLLQFLTIPVPDRDKEGDIKFLVYAVVETESGDFMARQLSEVKRHGFRQLSY